MPRKLENRSVVWAAVIVTAYLFAALAYVFYTPLWQAPDEPAHYNYVRYLIEHRAFPVLQPGDYDFDYLEAIKGARFPAEMSIDPIGYEYHQPPLYYILGATLTAPLPEGWRPVALRLLSVGLGMLLLVVVYRVGVALFPRQRFPALGAMAFVATVPMHVATTAAINNDTAAELILGLVIFLLIRRIRHPSAGHPWRNDVLLGVLIGMGLLTKMTTYIAVPLTGAVFFFPVSRKPAEAPAGEEPLRSRKKALFSLVRVLGAAFLLAVPWFVRNAVVYGDMDILGLARHDAIMAEQPRTADWLARLGWAGLAREFILTSFRSFWAQFGWMGVLVDDRIYLALTFLSVLTVLGFVVYLCGDFGRLEVRQRAGLGVLFLSLLFSLIAYLWYNTQFVQHQGRYLFPALMPLGVFSALGLWKLLDRRHAWYWAGLTMAGGLAFGVGGGMSGHLARWTLTMCAVAAAAFVARAFLPQEWRKYLFALPWAGLWALDILCLFGFIVPQLRP